MEIKTEGVILPTGDIHLRTALCGDTQDHVAQLTNTVFKMEDEATRTALRKLGWVAPDQANKLVAEVADLRRRYAQFESVGSITWQRVQRAGDPSWYLVEDATGRILCWLNPTKNLWKTNDGQYFIDLEKAKLAIEVEERDRLAAIAESARYRAERVRT